MNLRAVLKPSIALAVALAACSSGPKQPKPEDPKPDPVVEQPKPDPEPPQLAESELCGKVIERAKTSSGMSADMAAKIIPIVEKHCPTWSESVRRCLATAPDDEQQKCADDMDPALRDAFTKELMAAVMPPPECEDMGYTAGMWLKAPDAVSGADVDVVLAAVRPAIVASCRDASWSVEARRCVADASMDPSVCLDAADADAKAKLSGELAQREALFALALAYKETDKKIACNKVAAAHYGDAQWKTKLADRPKKEKTKLAKASAKALEKACKDDSWTPFVRGCVIAAKSEAERGWCLDIETKWGYPASAVEAPKPATETSSTGIPECDSSLTTVNAYAACDKIPSAARDAARKASEALKGAMPPTSNADAVAAAAQGCRTGMESLREGAATMGCSL